MFTPAKQSENQAAKPTVTNGSFFSGGGSMPFFQARLTVNQPGDAHEQEADAVADQVMRMKTGDAPVVQRTTLTPVSSVQRACAACEHEREHEKEGIQRKETSGGDASGKAAPSVVSDVLSSGGGQPMDGGTKQFMESRFGQDFSQVRIHTDARAAESASAIQARAYTSGRDVVFGNGEYQPSSEGGRRLLAHELVHVGQQGGNEKSMVQREGFGDVRIAEGRMEDEEKAKMKSQRGAHPCTKNNNGDFNAEFNCYFEVMKIRYQGLFEKQMEEVQTLKETAGIDDPPPFWKSLMYSAVEIALAGATGGIGSFVAIKVGKKLTASETMVKIATDIVKDATKAAVKKIGTAASEKVDSFAGKYPEGDQARASKICFDAQKDTLIDAKTEMLASLEAGRGTLQKNGEEGLEAAIDLESAVSDNYKIARDLQRKESVMQWAIYQAKGNRGITKDSKGTDMTSRKHPDFSNRPWLDDSGVLSLEGSWFQDQPLKITSAKMEGMNEALRKEIGKYFIRDLRIPIKLVLYAGRELSWSERNIGHKWQSKVFVRWNELNVPWYEPSPVWVSFVENSGLRAQQNLDQKGISYSVSESQIFEAIGKFKTSELNKVKPPF